MTGSWHPFSYMYVEDKKLKSPTLYTDGCQGIASGSVRLLLLANIIGL